MIHTTFNLLHRAYACTSGYRKLAKHLGGISAYGPDSPIPLAVVLDSNGIDDALWCLRATLEPSEAFSRDFACDCADGVRALLTDHRSTTAIDVARGHARGHATNADLKAASTAAWDAASDAASDAARAAARDAARAAARDAARDAARAAAWAAAWAAARDAALDVIAARFRARLLAHDQETNPLGDVPEPMGSLLPPVAAEAAR